MTVAAAPSGERAFDGAFDARRPCGQRLDVCAEVRDVGLDFGQVSADFLSDDLESAPVPKRRLWFSARTCAKVGADFCSQVAKFRPHFRETLTGVGPSVASDDDHKASQHRAY